MYRLTGISFKGSREPDSFPRATDPGSGCRWVRHCAQKCPATLIALISNTPGSPSPQASKLWPCARFPGRLCSEGGTRVSHCAHRRGSLRYRNIEKRRRSGMSSPLGEASAGQKRRPAHSLFCYAVHYPNRDRAIASGYRPGAYTLLGIAASSAVRRMTEIRVDKQFGSTSESARQGNVQPEKCPRFAEIPGNCLVGIRREGGGHLHPRFALGLLTVPST